jgi:hypothetical protein
MASAFALHVRSVSGDLRTVRISIAVAPVPGGFMARTYPDSARVHIRATGEDFQRLISDPPMIRLDPAQIPVPGNGTIPLFTRSVVFTPGTFTGTVERIEPAEVRVEIVPDSEPARRRNP